MSKLGNRTKNLLGKWKTHSQSVDVAGSAGALESALLTGQHAGNGLGSDPCMLEAGGSGVHSHGNGILREESSQGSEGGEKPQPAKSAKTQWSEHVWSEYNIRYGYMNIQYERLQRLKYCFRLYVKVR